MPIAMTATHAPAIPAAPIYAFTTLSPIAVFQAGTATIRIIARTISASQTRANIPLLPIVAIPWRIVTTRIPAPMTTVLRMSVKTQIPARARRTCSVMTTIYARRTVAFPTPAKTFR